MDLDSSVFTSSVDKNGTYWITGTVYFWKDGTRYWIPVSTEVRDPEHGLELEDVFRMLVTQLPGCLSKRLANNEANESAVVKRF